MAQLLVRNLTDDVKDRLRERAKENGRSLEAEARDILQDAVQDAVRDTGRPRKLGSELAALFRGKGFRKGEIQEWRGYPVEPAKFDE